MQEVNGWIMRRARRRTDTGRARTTRRVMSVKAAMASFRFFLNNTWGTVLYSVEHRDMGYNIR